MPNRRGFAWWMASNVGVGAATASYLNLLVPPFITDVTGNPARVGIVFAVMSLSAVAGPWICGIVDRRAVHRAAYLLAMCGMGAAFLVLSIDGVVDWYSPVFGVLLGVAYSVQGSLGPAFIAGIGLPPAVEARQLTAFALTYPAGQLLGAVVVAVAQSAGATPSAMFLIAAATLFIAAAVSWPSLAGPTQQLRKLAAARSVSPAAPRIDEAGSATRSRALVRTAFGAFLIVVVLSSAGNNGLTSQLANVMPDVYGFSASETSLLLGAAGLLNLVVIVLAGRQMARRGSVGLYFGGTVLRGAGALALALVALATNPALVAAAVAMLITYQGVPIPRLAAADVSVRLAPVSATLANGYYFAASALGSVTGCLVAGLLAASSMVAVVWLAAAAGVAATVVAAAWIGPATRRMQTH